MISNNKQLKKIITAILFSACSITGNAQTGNFTATFTSPNPGVKSITISFNKPVFKFDNPHGYWFVNPHNGQRHFDLMPDQGYGDVPNYNVGFFTFSHQENDFDIYIVTSDDSNAVTLKNAGFFITAPEYDVQKHEQNKPMHVHINTMTASEISFTLSGTAELSSSNGNGEKLGLGTITGSGHFYREPQFAKSDMVPGCNCDPVIYAAVFDRENNLRTSSECENALRNKIFDAVQKTFAPVFTNVKYTGSASPIPAGEITVTAGNGNVNTDVPVKDRPWCSGDYYHNRIVGVDAFKKIFTNDDTYGLRFMKMPTDEELHPATTFDAKANMMEQMAVMDSLNKLMLAKKITQEQMFAKLKAYSDKNDAVIKAANSNAPDMKKAEMEHNVYISILFNSSTAEDAILFLNDNNKAVVQHNVKGAAFELFSPEIKDEDGNWTGNRLYVYLGKFTNPVLGKSLSGIPAETTKAIYPPNANKLSVYNIVIKMSGNKEMIDKATANMDFNALQELITK